MYDEAARIAREIEEKQGTFVFNGLVYPGNSGMQRALERIDNLCKHAREELEDERLRLRDGWPQV